MAKPDERVVVLAPSAHDGPVTVSILSAAGFECVLAGDIPALCRTIGEGAAVALVAQEALTPAGARQMTELLDRQEPWSDLPVIVFTGRGRGIHARVEKLATSGNVTLLERPVEKITLLSVVRAALRARRRQYAARAVLAELQAVLDAVPAAVFIARDAEARTVDANRFCAEALRMPLGATVSKSAPGDAAPGFRAMRGGQDIPPDRLPVQVAAVTRSEVRDYEFDLLFPDGEVRHMFGNATPLRGPDGAPQGAVGAFLDITDRKRNEEALREADRRKDEFLGMLSHELRNPLAPIRNAIYILDHADPGGEQARRARAVITRQTEHLTRLVEDLLDVTRIARGKIELRRARLDVRELVLRAAEDFQPVIAQRGVALHVAVPGGKTWVDADATRVMQVVGNLLHNAAKFTRPGDEVTLSLRAADGAAEISVRDTGAGLDPALVPKVFDPFVQGEHTLARTEGGLGLGLALVKGIAELHGGSVRAESAGMGRGAEFVVRLPLAPPPEAEERPHRPLAPTSARRRVLVVDDNRDAAESLTELLRLQGHAAEVVFDGPSAVERARVNPPDVVLCDIGLPGMDGYAVARALRKLGRPVRIVALSGYAQPEDVRASLEAGFDSHLAKPCDPDEVRRLIG